MRFFRYSPAVTKRLRYWKSQRPVGSSRARVSYRPSMEISSEVQFYQRFRKEYKMHFTRGFRRNTNDAPLRTKLSAKKPPSLCVFFSDAPQPEDDLLHLRGAVQTKISELPRLLLSLFFWYQHSRRQMLTPKGVL